MIFARLLLLVIATAGLAACTGLPQANSLQVNVAGVAPLPGEELPVTVSMLRLARQVLGALDGPPVDRIRYELYGKLQGVGIGSLRFRSQGELALPSSTPATDAGERL